MEDRSKICLITGASSGIGHGIARSLLTDPNNTLIVTARRETLLDTLRSDAVQVAPGDLNSPDFQDYLEEFIYRTYGRCDYLFNCAGMLEVGSIEQMDIERMAAMMRLNIESTFRLTYKFLKRFKIQGYGHVVNISSVLGTKVRPTAGAYAATKYAMEALSEALRMELSETNIKITCIEPGLVSTELHNNWEVHPSVSMGIKDPLLPEDIAGIVQFIMHQPDHVRIPKLMVLPRGHII